MNFITNKKCTDCIALKMQKCKNFFSDFIILFRALPDVYYIKTYTI